MLLVVTGLAILGVVAVVVVPRVVLERAKDPGLGVRALHAQGVTGAGVHVAIAERPNERVR